MEHTKIVNESALEDFAEMKDSEHVVPELISMLVNESASDLTTSRIPYGRSVNQPGFDGLVETAKGFAQFIPMGRSYWEIGTGHDPQKKASEDFNKRTDEISPPDRTAATFVFVTPRSGGSGGWIQPKQIVWLNERKDRGWGGIKIIDGIVLADWLRDFPVFGRWLLRKMGLTRNATGFITPAEYWENLQQFVQSGDPPLPAALFLTGRDEACRAVEDLFRGGAKQMLLSVENEHDATDFVAAFLASSTGSAGRSFGNRCLFVHDEDAWQSMVNLKIPHVLVAHQRLDLENSGEQLHMAAKKRSHAVIIPVSDASMKGGGSLIPLRSPSASVLEATLSAGGYQRERARELASVGALSLAGLKRHLRGLGALPPYATWKSARELAQAGLIGRWSGENPADKSAMEILLGKGYGEWIEILRHEILRSDTPLTQLNENWKVICRGEAWSALGTRLSNDDLEGFRKTVVGVLGERDPKFDLPKDERFTAGIHGKVMKHSSSLRKGMAETLALLGSKPQALSKCSNGKAEDTALLVVRELLKGDDWGLWASLNEHLPLLAEAAPDEFLDAVEAALSKTSENPFNALFRQESSGITGWNYMTGLLWALETLAWHPDFFMRAIRVLGDLAAIDPGGNWANRPANSLVTILLPWHPQTLTAIPKRIAAARSLIQDHPSVAWKLLIALLPNQHQVTSGSCRPVWRGFIPPEWSETITNGEYWEQIVGYADLAVELAATDLSRLAELIDSLPDLPGKARLRVLEHLGSSVVLALPEAERLPLWEALVDLWTKHRKYADAKWAMEVGAVTKIEEAAQKLAPSSPLLLHRRLFSARDIELFDEKGDYKEQSEKLRLRRQVAVREILDSGQMEGLLDFTRQVANPWIVGQALGSVEWQPADTFLLPRCLGREDKHLHGFVGAFIWSRLQMKDWVWVDAVMDKDWTTEQKTVFFSLLPFVKDAWRRAESVLGKDAGHYWKLTNANPFEAQADLLEAVEKLLLHGRPRAALGCLDRLIDEKKGFPPDWAVRALKDNLKRSDDSNVIEQHATQEIIKWLQNNPSTDPQALFQIEWAYLPLLDHRYGGTPTTLEQGLATDPGFFCELISLVFRSDNKEAVNRQLTEKEKNFAKNAYQLLHGWKKVPGTRPDGSFDAARFSAWLAEVKQRCEESGHLRIAMSQFGQVLPHAPAAADGLWIHHEVAKALDARDAGEMRSGFTCKLFNMRGVHGFTVGKEERTLATKYRERADALDENGYSSFAAAMRELAKSYERDAEREAQRSPFDD